MSRFLTQRIWLVEHERLLLTLLICAAWVLPGLVGHDPWKPDEAYTFGLVYHIIQTGNWLVPTLAGEPFMEKPPIFFMVAALFGKLFSPILPLHDAVRLAAGFFTALTLLLTGLTARELSGPGKGHLAALVLIGCLGFLVRSHELLTDTALLTGMAMAWYGLARARRRGLSGGLWLGTGIGVAFLAKGLIGPGMVGIVAILLAALPPWRNRHFWTAVAVAAVASLPWLLIWPWQLYQHSSDLFYRWLIDNNLGRFLGLVRLGPKSEPGYYLETLPWFAFPALPLALWAWWRRRSQFFQDAGSLLTCTSFFAMLAVLMFAHDARDVYALPLLLPLAVAASDGIDSLRRGAVAAFDWFGIMAFGLFSAILWLGWFAMVSDLPARIHGRLMELQPGYTPEFLWTSFLAALLWTLAWLAYIFSTRRSPRRALATWAGGITVFWCLAMTLWLPWINTGKTYRSMIADMAQHLPAAHGCVSSRFLGEPQRAMLDYFANLQTLRIETHPDAECRFMLVQGSAGEEKPPQGGWTKIWEGARPGDRKERYWLYEQQAVDV